MTKPFLEYQMRLFALIANNYPNVLFENVNDFIKSFILKEFNSGTINENLKLFNEHYQNIRR